MAKAVFDTIGWSRTPEYRTWCAMRHRCLFSNDINYARYGGRGITICKEWTESFQSFLKDMGPRPAGLSLDRKDNDGPYCKDNCQWATCKEQAQRSKQREYKTRSQMIMPRLPKSGYRGIEKMGNRWRAIFRGRKLGNFLTLQEAISAWNKAVSDAYGANAKWLNERVA
jgi:hypothetical protein